MGIRSVIAVLALFLVAVSAAFAAGAGDGTYRGDDVVVKVKDGKVAKFTATVYASCGTSSLLLTVAYPPTGGGKPIKVRDKAFRKSFQGDPNVSEDKRTISGEFHGKTIEGSIEISGLCEYEGTYEASR